MAWTHSRYKDNRTDDSMWHPGQMFFWIRTFGRFELVRLHWGWRATAISSCSCSGSVRSDPNVFFGSFPRITSGPTQQPLGYRRFLPTVSGNDVWSCRNHHAWLWSGSLIAGSSVPYAFGILVSDGIDLYEGKVCSPRYRTRYIGVLLLLESVEENHQA